MLIKLKSSTLKEKLNRIEAKNLVKQLYKS
jgi:hypothetical protein